MEREEPDDDADFCRFVEQAEPRLRRTLVAMYGPEDGRDATAEALAYAWQHFPRVRSMVNPTGYLFRVAQSRSRRRRAGFAQRQPVEASGDVEPALLPALSRLSPRQRAAVVLCVAYEWTVQEVADLMGISRGSVQRHLDRGMSRLRVEIGDDR